MVKLVKILLSEKVYLLIRLFSIQTVYLLKEVLSYLSQAFG